MVRLLNNEEIICKVDAIVEYIKNTDTYINYKKYEEIIKENERITSLIREIKKCQQDIVNQRGSILNLEKRIKEMLEELESEPTYVMYKNLQDEINNMLTIFENKLNKYFYDVFN